MGEYISRQDYPVKTTQQRKEQRNMWFGLIGPPLAFLVSLQVNYSLVDWCCLNNVRWPLYVMPLVFLAISIGCGLLANTERLRFERRATPDSERSHDRTHFMLVMGATVAIFASLAILGQLIAVLFIDPCQP